MNKVYKVNQVVPQLPGGWTGLLLLIPKMLQVAY